MADDKKKFVIANDEFDDIDATTKNVVITDSEFDDIDDSPKSPAPSMKGGESGAVKTPSTSTSVLEDLESGSWTQTINPNKQEQPVSKPVIEVPKSVKQVEEVKKLSNQTLGEILKKSQEGYINPDLEAVVGSIALPGGGSVPLKEGKIADFITKRSIVPNKDMETDIDILVDRTNVTRDLKRNSEDRLQNLSNGIKQIQEEGAFLNERYKSNPTPELEAELNQLVKNLQQTQREYNLESFRRDVYEKRILQTSDSIKKLANDQVPEDFFSGIYQGWRGNVDSWGKSYNMAKMNKKELIQFAKDEGLKAPTKESSTSGEGGQMVGGVVNDVLVAAGFTLAGLPMVGATTVATRQGAQQAAEDFVRVFNEIKASGLPSGKKDANGNDIMRPASDDEAYDKAVRAAGFGAVTGFAEGMVGATPIGGALAVAVGKKAVTQKAKIAAMKAVDTGLDAAVAGGMQFSRNLYDRSQGLKTELGSGVLENMAGEVLLSAPINTISGVVEYNAENKKKAVKEIFQAVETYKSNPNELVKLEENLDILKNQGLISESDHSSMKKRVSQYMSVIETIPSEIKEKQEVADMIIERNELEDKKKSVDKAFQKGIDEQIENINNKLVEKANEAKPIELKKNTSPTSEKYGTINRNDGKGVVDLTKEEYEAEQAKMQSKADEQVTPTAEGEQVNKSTAEFAETKFTPIPNPTVVITGLRNGFETLSSNNPPQEKPKDIGRGRSKDFDKDGILIDTDNEGNKTLYVKVDASDAFGRAGNITVQIKVPNGSEVNQVAIKKIIDEQVEKMKSNNNIDLRLDKISQSDFDGLKNAIVEEIEKPTTKTNEKEPTKKEDGEPMSGGVQGLRTEGQAGKESAELRTEEEEVTPQAGSVGVGGDVESKKSEIEKLNNEIDSFDNEYNSLVDIVNKEDRRLNAPKSENEIKLNELQDKINILRDKRDKIEQSLQATPQAGSVGVGGDKIKLDPDLANIDPILIAARNGDVAAQKQFEEMGLDWKQTTTYRFVGQSEVDVLLSNEKVESKRGMADAGIDVTSSPKVTTAATGEYRVTFKESFDKNNGLGKVRKKNEEDSNLERGRGYDINDVAKIERIDEKGNVVETIYDQSKAGSVVDVESAYGNFLLNEIDKRHKEKYNGENIKSALAKQFNETLADRGENRAISNLEDVYMNYVPEGVKPQAYQALRKNFEKEQSLKETPQEELLTPKQEEDAKKQQSGQMREQGVQDQPQRKGDSDMPIINEAELQDGEAVEEEVTQEELNKQQDKETQVLLNGEAAKRRSAGKFIKDGVEYVRNKVDKGIRGIKGSVKFAEGVPNMPFTYKLVEAETLQPSHSQGVRNQMHFIPEAQPKRRNDEGSVAAEIGFANNPRFNELGENTNAYSGAPVVNERNEVVQGNNRSAGLKIGYDRGNKKYKNDLADNAEKFGFTREQVEGMKNPVLVREVAFSDEGAIEYGNYDAKDLETGGKRRIDPLALVKRIPLKEKARLAKLLFSGEGTLNSNIRANSKDVLAILNPFLNQAQRTTLLKDGEITSSGVEDIEALVQQFLFDNGDMALPELFENLPYRQREGIRKSLPFIFSAGVEADVIPEIQNAILALNQFQSTGIENFDTWLNQSDVFADNKTPRDIYTPQELAIARALNEAKTQSEIVDKFKSFSSAVQGTPETPANLIDEAKPAIEGQSKEEALKQIFNVKENESRQKENLRGGKKVDKQQEAPKQKPKEPTAEEVEEEGLPKLTKEQQIEAERRSLNEPKNVSDLAKIFNKVLGLSPKESVMAARLFDVKAKNMSELLGITKDEYYQRYWFTGEQEGGLSQMTLPDGRKVTVKSVSAEVVNGFYSNTENALGQVKQEKMSGNQWATQLLSRGANKEEMQFTGLEAFLKENAAKPISKADIQQFLKDNRIQVVEVVKSDDKIESNYSIRQDDDVFDVMKNGVYSKKSFGTIEEAEAYINSQEPEIKENTKFSQYQLEGQKENYKEVLVTMPKPEKRDKYEVVNQDNGLFTVTKNGKEFKKDLKYSQASNYLNINSVEGKTTLFKSSHFDEPNILVHLRMNTRTDAEGNKVLFLEEVQSDWGQEGKKEGFKQGKNIKITNVKEFSDERVFSFENGQEIRISKLAAPTIEEAIDYAQNKANVESEKIGSVPTAPFVTDTNAWTKLGLKYALKEAVKQGATKIAWTTGEQQNERYDLSKSVDKLEWVYDKSLSKPTGTLYGWKDGRMVMEETMPENRLEDYIGKGVAENLLKASENDSPNYKGYSSKMLTGEEIKVGGKGMKGFYGSPTEGSLGIVGNVAKSLFKQEPKTVDIIKDEQPLEYAINVFIQWAENKGIGANKAIEIWDNNGDLKKDFKKVVDNQDKSLSTQPSIDITPELKAQVQEGLPLFQDRRGAWSKIAASAKRIISMYDKARLDTAVHEILGHDFLDEIISLSATNKEFEQDLNTIIDEYIKSSGNKTSKATLLNELKNFNVESNNQSVNARAIHEWFSRTAEGYFMGETNIKPDSKLAKMFEQFRQYLTDLFNTMTSRNYIIPSEPMKQIFRKAFGAENFDFVNDYAEANIMEGKLDVLRITENEIPQSRLDKFKKLREAKRGLGQEEDVDIDELVDAARYLSTDPTVNVFSVVDELVSMYPQKEEYIRKHSKTFEKVFVAEGKKVRETARSVYESEVVSPEMKQRAATIEDLFSYTPEKLQEKMEDVESLIADYSIDDLMAFFATNNEIPFKEYPLFLAAMQKRISRAINELNNSNQGQSAAKQKLLNYEMTIMDRYIAEGTATGQRLNYFKVLKNMSTDGKLRFFKRKFKEESGNAVKEFQDLISNLRKERDKAYKDNDYFLEENLSLEQRIEDLEAELAKERSIKAKNDKRKDRESSISNYKNPPKSKISQSELNDILKELGSAGLGQSLEDLNASLKLGFYIIQDKKKTIEQFTRDWNKITKQNKTQEELSQVYRDVRKYATENEGVDIDDFDSDAMIQSSIDSFNERASQKKNLAKKELDSDIAKAEKEAKDKDDAPSQLAKAILSNAKKELGLGKKQQDYVKELLGYLKNKAKDYYKTTNKQALVDPFEQLKYAVEMLNDANGRKIWDDSKAELIAKIDSDKDLSQQEKDDLKAYLNDYQNAIFDQLLSKNKLFNNVKKVLAEESPFVKKDGSVDWNGIIIQAKGNVEIAKQIILDSVADKIQGYSGSQVNSVIDAIGREYQRRINEKRAEIIEKQLKDISDKKVIFKKKIATGFVQKLVEMENSGALGDQRFEQALKEWIGFSDMTPDKWSRLRELIVDAEEAPEGNERDRAIENLSAYIKFNKIGKFAEIYASAYYAGLLARPTTIIKNSTGIIEPLLTLFYKSFTDRNYAKAMLQGLKRGDAADIWGGGLVQGGKLDEETGNDGLPRVNMLKQWKMQEKGIIPKLFALGAKPLDLLSMADALSQAMVERGAEYEFYARYLLEKNKEDIRNGVQGVAPITEKEARKIAIKRLSDDAMLDWAFAQAEDEFASRKIVPSSARLNRRAYEIVSESLLPTSVRELAQNLALEESYKSKLISFRGMTSQTRAQKRLETNYGVATFIGSFAKGLVDLLAEGGGYVAGGATKVLPVTEARRNQIRNSVERSISMRVLPFARGISNVVEKSLEKTPYGIVSGVIGATAEKLSYGKPKTIDEILQHQYMMNRNKAKIAKSATSMIIGSAIYYTLLSASKEWDDEEEKEERYYLPTGFYSAGETVRFSKNKIERYTLPVNCVVLFGRIIPLSLFGTVGIGSMITAQAYDNFLSKEKKKQGAVVDPDNPESIKGFSSFVSSSGNAILNMSAMQSISELQESVSSKGTMDFGDYASKLSVKSIALPIPFSGTANQIIQGARYLSGDKTAQAAIGADEKIYKELGLAGIVYNRPVLDWRGRPVNAVLQNQEGIASFVSMLDKRPLDKIDMYLLKELEFNPVIDKRLSENFADLNMVGMSKDEYYDYTKKVGMTANNYIEAYFEKIKDYQIPQDKIDELAAEGKNETDLKKQLKTIKKTFVSDFLNIAEQEHMLNYQLNKGIIKETYEAKFKANNDRLENLIEKINDKGK